MLIFCFDFWFLIFLIICFFFIRSNVKRAESGMELRPKRKFTSST